MFMMIPELSFNIKMPSLAISLCNSYSYEDQAHIDEKI